ncbi:MAG TPA: PfkB family carbohydrate kinase [Solirubrobacteraceae bacterium]|nr:PfkB family carbohydrate kinase [Solirubrobacteraceae bacterium]
MNLDLHYDYTAVGHVTIDVLADGARQPGGSAFYSAVQAARLGRRTLILTRGRAGEIELLLEPYARELDLRVLPAAHTTTLATAGRGAERRQRVLAWAGPMPEDLALDTAILHLAPVARETPGAWRGRVAFVGLTPQGLARAWSQGGEMGPARPSERAAAVAARCDAIVMSRHERASCAELILAATRCGARIAITAAADPTLLIAPGGDELEVDVPALEAPGEDLGAGDVFAAAFFIALGDGLAAAHAARFANAAAAVRMRGAGARAIGAREEIEARLHATGGTGE